MEGLLFADGCRNAGGGIRGAPWFGISGLYLDALSRQLPVKYKAQYNICAGKDLGPL